MKLRRKHLGQIGCFLVLLIFVAAYGAVSERFKRLQSSACLTPFLSDRIRGYVFELHTHQAITNAEITVRNTTPRISDCYDAWERTERMPLLDEDRLFTDARGYFESHINADSWWQYTIVISAGGCETSNYSDVGAAHFGGYSTPPLPVPIFYVDCN